MVTIKELHLIGTEVAISWQDGTESFYDMAKLRMLSPSAETKGETDLFGNDLIDTDRDNDFSGVTVTNWQMSGNYAVNFEFSDGHKTGLYTLEYLRKIAEVGAA
ncbi:MAG: DUF971 domain-containing protein [Verrucomicrobiota bacterium]